MPFIKNYKVATKVMGGLVIAITAIGLVATRVALGDEAADEDWLSCRKPDLALDAQAVCAIAQIGNAKEALYLRKAVIVLNLPMKERFLMLFDTSRERVQVHSQLATLSAVDIFLIKRSDDAQRLTAAYFEFNNSRCIQYSTFDRNFEYAGPPPYSRGFAEFSTDRDDEIDLRNYVIHGSNFKFGATVDLATKCVTEILIFKKGSGNVFWN